MERVDMSGIGTNPASVVDNFDLKLFGDKMKLAVRPINKESTASSRCALLGRNISRPSSAIPALNLYSKEEDFHIKIKRPFSAGYIQHKTTHINNHSNNSTSTESLYEDKDLPSTQICQELISESEFTFSKKCPEEIQKKMVSETEFFENNQINNVITEENRQSSREKPFEYGFSKKSHEEYQSNIENPENSSPFNNCLLTPGLTTKPPLPKKPEQNHLKLEDEIEIIRLKSLQFDKEFSAAVEEAYTKSNDIMTEKEFENYLEKSSYDLEKKIFEDFLQEKASFQNKEDSHKKEINFLPIELEEENAVKTEKKTDGFLKSLKIKHEEIDKCISKAHKVLEKNKNECEIKKTSTKEVKNKSQKTKPKFIAKPITSFKDQVPNQEISQETWMEKDFGRPSFNSTAYHDSKLNSQMKVDNWLNDDKTKKTDGNKTTFFEILEKVEDLDLVTRVEDEHLLKEIPEHDKEDVSDTNTYDDIVQILEVLEEEDRKSHQKIQSMKEILDLKQKDHIPIIKVTQASRASSATSHSSDQGLGSTVSLISNSTNYTEILSYLDEVDKTCTKSLQVAKQKVQKVTKALEGTVVFSTIPKKEDLSQLTTEELSEQIIDLHLRVKDKSSSIKLLQDELSSLRDQVLKITKQTEDIVKQKLKSQKDEHENIVKRHQKFIDQLIADKKALNQQCEGLINEMKLLEDRYTSNMKAAEHKHQVEMKKAKEMHLAGEKIRRERWIEGKTQKIKELTVKSIEPELQSMTLRHERELSDLRALHKKEIEDLEMKSARKTQQQLETLREQLGEEREKAVTNEREVMNQRYKKLVESEEKNYQEQRRRLQQEHAKKVLECEEKEVMITTEKERAIKLAQEEFEEKLQASVRRHNNEMKILKETTEMEMEAWKNNYRKQQTIQLVEKETKMREQFKKERDREIEEVIERLEAETNENRQQMEITTENRIRRMREKFENEIKELEKSENDANIKYGETKTKLLECEDMIIGLKATIKQLEGQLSVCQEVSSKLTAEKDNMKDIVRREMKEDMEELEKEVNRLRNEKNKELQQVYSRVKIAIAKKDEMLQELSRDYSAMQEKCVYLENMLEQQRKEYLIK